MLGKLATYAYLYLKSVAAHRYARRRGIPGLDLARYGRRIGVSLLLRRMWSGLDYLIDPVNITRYFEFPFVLSCLPGTLGDCLDVSSPRLLSFYVARQRSPGCITMINPDTRDLDLTARMAQVLALRRLSFVHRGVDWLVGQAGRFDCIWSISVVEHIAGPCDDTRAVQLMYSSLKPGGRLILTVPVDRRHWDEYRSDDYYGTAVARTDRGYFFQRFYDRASIHDRLLDPLGQEPTVMRWFGETTPGRFHRYIAGCLEQGLARTAADAREIADGYREFASWEEMPGAGVCGLMLER